MVRSFVLFIFIVPAGLSFLFVFSLCVDDEAEYFCVELMVSQFRVLLMVSKFQVRSSASA